MLGRKLPTSMRRTSTKTVMQVTAQSHQIYPRRRLSKANCWHDAPYVDTVIYFDLTCRHCQQMNMHYEKKLLESAA
jgi:hypothetical protein